MLFLTLFDQQTKTFGNTNNTVRSSPLIKNGKEDN